MFSNISFLYQKPPNCEIFLKLTVCKENIQNWVLWKELFSKWSEHSSKTQKDCEKKVLKNTVKKGFFLNLM